MGIALSCCGRSTETEDSNALTLRPGLPKGRLIVKLMVEVNALSSDDGPLRWEPYLNGLVPLWLSCVQEGDTYIYEVTASAADGRTFSSNILVPGTVLRKTSECFVQWRDLEKGGAWGLNFASESDITRFLAGCTPPGTSPQAAGLKCTSSSHSLALPTPAPPTTTLRSPLDQSKESSFTVNRPLSQGQFSTASGADRLPTPDMSVQSLPLDNPHPERYTPPPGFGLNSPKRADDAKFEFPTPLIAGVVTVTIGTSTPVPFNNMETAPLTDIQEDREIERLGTQEYIAPSCIMNTTTVTNESTAPNYTQDDFDIPLPSALPPPPPATLPPSQNALSNSRLSQFLNDIDSSLLEFTGIKLLSPPSPLKEEEETNMEPKAQPTVQDPGLHSIGGAAGDREMRESSSIIDLGEMVLEVSELDGYRAQFKDEIVNRHNKVDEEEEEEVQDKPDGSNQRQQEGEVGDRLSPLPPATTAEDDDTSPLRSGNLKITPSFLRTLLPPQEFSSICEPLSTGEGSARAQEVAKEKRGAGRPRDLRNSFTSTQYKEELLPVHGYSGGSKTNTSSGSLKSTSSDGDKAGRADYNGDETRTNSQDDLILPSAATRKAGWLEVKTVLVRKNQTVAMKPKRRWKKYWAALKGIQLVLYQCSDPTAIPENQPSDMTLGLELSLAHPIHDHMKRDHVFCLSTYNNGDTFYLQTTGQSDVEDWIRAIHSAAAASLIQSSTKEESLQQRIEKLNDLISSENQLSKLAELELKTVADYASRSAIMKQLVKFSENVERYSVELYKLRCYVASAHGEETPNPQSLLGHISKTTKTFLSNIGMFSVASLHALVCARDAGSPFSSGYSQRQTSKAKLTSPALSRRLGLNGAKTKTTAGISSKFSARFKKSNITSHDISGPISLSPLPLPAMKQEDPIVNETDNDGSIYMEGSDPGDMWTNIACTIQVKMPNNKVCSIPLRSQMTVRDVLVSCCEKHRLEAEDHFLRLRTETYGGEFECDIPNENERLTQLYSKLTKVELCQKLIHTVILSKPDNKQFGLTLEPSEDDGLGRVVVTKVEEGSPADTQDINEGDEVLLINDNLVTNLLWDDIIAAIKAPSISLTLRTSQIEMPLSGVLYSNVLNSLVCPPPPSNDDIITKETLEGLIIPMPSLEDLTKIGLDGVDERVIPSESVAHSQEQIDALIKDSRAISVQVRAWDAMEVEDSQPVSKGAPWTSEDRLRKCIEDLLETEQQHAKTIEVLIERYLQPMRKELIVSQDEITALSGNITEVADFENKFLRSLEESVASNGQDGQTTGTAKVVMAIATAFLCNAEQLQLYSGLCTSHSRACALGEIKDNEKLQSFLDARNPGKNPRLTLDSLLGKLILRVSRYPLFLRSMLDNTIDGSEERHQLLVAIESTVRGANYINEMQRVSEMYSSLFDSLLRESGMADYGVSVNVGQLRCHGEVMWLNQKDELLGRAWKKGQGPNVLCFVFNSCLILLQKEKKGRRRTSKTKLSSEVTTDEVKHKLLWPCLLCRVQDVPDSDGVTNMWQLLYKSQPSQPAVPYLFRSNSVEQKATMVHLVRDSIQEQQKLFGTLSETPSPSLHGHGSVVGSSSSTLSQPVRTKTNSKFPSLFTAAYSTQTL